MFYLFKWYSNSMSFSKWTFKIMQDAENDVKAKKRNKYSVGIGPARFQLQYMGHYLIWDERKDPDPRVQDFIPDTWQVILQMKQKLLYLFYYMWSQRFLIIVPLLIIFGMNLLMSFKHTLLFKMSNVDIFSPFKESETFFYYIDHFLGRTLMDSYV